MALIDNPILKAVSALRTRWAVVIVVEGGDPHCRSALRRSRKARPNGVRPTIQRPLISSRVTTPRPLTSSQTREFRAGRAPRLHHFFVASLACCQPLQDVEDEGFH